MVGLRALALGAAGLVLMAGSAVAADLILDTPPVMDAAATDWSGFYAGVGITGINSSSIVEHIVSLDGIVGANVQSGQFVFGGEGYLTANWSDLGTPVYGVAGAEIRGGFLATEAVLLYGAVGAEATSGGSTYGTIGGGIEFMAMGSASIDLEYKHYFPLNNAWTGDSIGASVLWHF